MLKDNVKFVHAFVIAFKQQDNRMTASLRSMIGLLQKMFGDRFWENAILEATHWSHHPYNEKLRLQSNPQLTEKQWAAQHNALLRKEFGVEQEIPAVFIDTFYTNSSQTEFEGVPGKFRKFHELQKFKQHTEKLWQFASERDPFELKDIKRALSEIGELRANITERKRDIEKQEELLVTLRRYNKHCLSQKCYTRIELALYGAGFLVLGLFVAVVLVAVYQNRRPKAYSYDVDDIDRCKKATSDKSDLHSEVSLSVNSDINTIESFG